MNSKLVRSIINVVLVLIILCFVWPFDTPRQGILIKSIGAPISFKNEKERREALIIQRLDDIRQIETMYKQEYNRYTDDFDSLIYFCNTYKIPIIKTIIHKEDTAYFNEHNDYRTSSEVIDSILVKDSLFGKRPDFNINHIRFVPGVEPPTKFEIHSDFVPHGGISVPVIEVKTPFEVYLAKPGPKFTEKEWNTRVKNEKAELEQLDKYAGKKFGSLQEATTDGNWEKL